MFTYNLEQGFKHILDLDGYDHMLFLLALTAGYQLKHWKKILGLVTAFTIGHMITLYLAGLDQLRVNRDLIEFLIPLTILLTSIYQLSKSDKQQSQPLTIFSYALTLGFGLIHGLGFSSFFKVMQGRHSSIYETLIPFNLGVELGQLVIVAILILIGTLVLKITRINESLWRRFLAILAILISIYLMTQTWPF